MASKSRTIDLDYKKAMNQAEELEEAASKLAQEAAKLRDHRSQVSAAWRGESATAYLKKVRSIEAELQQSAKQIRKCASTIRAIAKTTYAAEKTAEEIARTRSVKSM